MNIVFSAATNQGKVRAENEDSFYLNERENIWVVCDGMGGGVAGGLASRLTAKAVVDLVPGLSSISLAELKPFYDNALPEKAVRTACAIQIANRMLFNLSVEYPQLQGMGTTVCCVAIEGGIAYIAHVGDSRVYAFENEKLKKLTKDHSLLMELLEDKEISKKEAERFKQKNVITRALGASANCELDLYMFPITEDTRYIIICTDGLWNEVSEKEIETEIIRSEASPSAICKNLIKRANNKGGPDNITVTALRIIDITGAKVRFNRYFDKAVSILIKDKQFERNIDREAQPLITEARNLLPKSVRRAKCRQTIKIAAFYIFLIVVLVALLVIMKIKFSGVSN